MEKTGIARRYDHPELMPRNTLSDDILQSSVDQLKPIVTGRANVVVLIIPARALWIEDHSEVETRVHERFIELLAPLNLRIVDMKPILERDGAPLQYYFKTDPHWNPAGHELAAKALFDEINEDPGIHAKAP